MDEYAIQQQGTGQRAEFGARSRIGSSEGRVERALRRMVGADWLARMQAGPSQDDEYARLEQLHHTRRERNSLFEGRARQLEELLGCSGGEGV